MRVVKKRQKICHHDYKGTNDHHWECIEVTTIYLLGIIPIYQSNKIITSQL